MPGSPGAAWLAIKRHRERYAKMTPKERLEDDHYWTRQAKIDNIVFGSLILVICFIIWMFLKV